MNIETAKPTTILKYDKKYNKRFPFEQNRFIDSVTNKFLKLSEQTEDIQTKIRSRVFVGMNHNIFEMSLCEKTKIYEHSLEQNESMGKASEVSEKATQLAFK